ncbi:MAG: [protein-PII] uridylyltransferase, partial [Pseudomonadota bacterium]
MRPRRVLAGSGPEVAAPSRPPTPRNLIVPGDALFDVDAVRAAVVAAIAAADPTDARRVCTEVLSSALKDARAMVAEAFRAEPLKARPTTSAYAYVTDCIVTLTYEAAMQHLPQTVAKKASDTMAVLAVGGYGRGEMAPHSDVDLLFLTGPSAGPWCDAIVETMLYILWDLRLKVGHATRTPRDCIQLAREDYTIRTTLVECRTLCGDADLPNALRDRLWKDLFRTSAPDFIEAKLSERAERHRKQGGQRYMVEPNVKEGKGGLRDLQSLFWIAKYIHNVSDAADLVPLGLFTMEEFDSFIQAEDFQWAVRCHLHLITGRATDQLTFDLQVEVADRMGYADSRGRRAVEYFMQDYFLHATEVGELTRIFLTALEDAHVKTEPRLLRFFRKPK